MANIAKLAADALGWNGNVNPNFKESHYLEPVACSKGDGAVDNGIVDGAQLFTAKEFTVQPAAKSTISDGGACDWTTPQAESCAVARKLQTPAMIRFDEMIEDEVFLTAKAVVEGVTFENTGAEPLVGLR